MSKEVFFDESDFIVSKTDTRGMIKYVNNIFIKVSGFQEDELIDRPHSIIRHEKMPRCIFDYFWATLKEGKEMFAYVVNICKNGDYYWVLAYVTPDLDPDTGEVVGYHSVRRVPSRRAVREIEAIYKTLVDIEKRQGSKKAAIHAGMKKFSEILKNTGMEYEEWVYSLN
jgi:PAS domain S-box-containing protein